MGLESLLWPTNESIEMVFEEGRLRADLTFEEEERRAVIVVYNKETLPNPTRYDLIHVQGANELPCISLLRSCIAECGVPRPVRGWKGLSLMQEAQNDKLAKSLVQKRIDLCGNELVGRYEILDVEKNARTIIYQEYIMKSIFEVLVWEFAGRARIQNEEHKLITMLHIGIMQQQASLDIQRVWKGTRCRRTLPIRLRHERELLVKQAEEDDRVFFEQLKAEVDDAERAGRDDVVALEEQARAILWAIKIEEGSDTRGAVIRMKQRQINEALDDESRARVVIQDLEKVQRMAVLGVLRNRIQSTQDMEEAAQRKERMSEYEKREAIRQEREAARQLRLRRARAAVLIQSWQRGNWGRARAANHKCQREVEENERFVESQRRQVEAAIAEARRHEEETLRRTREKASCILIQRILRGFLVRRRRNIVRRVWMRRVREQLERANMAAADAQRKHEVRYCAARMIQSCWRCHTAHLSSQSLKMQLTERSNLDLDQSRLQELNYAAGIIQDSVQFWIARKEAHVLIVLKEQLRVEIKREVSLRKLILFEEKSERAAIFSAKATVLLGEESQFGSSVWDTIVEKFTREERARALVLRREKAVITMQRAVRVLISRIRYLKLKEDRDFRKRQEQVAMELNNDNIAKRRAAALELQRFGRGLFSRHRVAGISQLGSVLVCRFERVARFSLVTEEDLSRKRILREEQVEARLGRESEKEGRRKRFIMLRTVIRVQCWWRGVKARKIVGLMTKLRDERLLVTRHERLRRRQIEGEYTLGLAEIVSLHERLFSKSRPILPLPGERLTKLTLRQTSRAPPPDDKPKVRSAELDYLMKDLAQLSTIQKECEESEITFTMDTTGEVSAIGDASSIEQTNDTSQAADLSQHSWVYRSRISPHAAADSVQEMIAPPRAVTVPQPSKRYPLSAATDFAFAAR